MAAALLVAGAAALVAPTAAADEQRGVRLASGAAVGSAGGLPTERRVALVIGNGAYRNAPPLANPPNDARLIAEAVRAAGFELVGGKVMVDLDRTGTEQAIRSFGQQLRGGAIGLFYYAGHGLQISGANYLVPVSANLSSEADVKYELVDVNFVLDEMVQAGNRLNVIILDACRNNPFGGRGLRAVSGGLAQMQAPSGTVISYATQPGNVAADGANGNSPYTEALASSMRTPGRSVFEVFNEVGVAVKKKTSGVQQPWLATSPIEGQFYFVPVVEAATPSVPVSPPASAAPAYPMMSVDKEALYWESIKDSNNPSFYNAYLGQFPTGVFAGLARAKLEALAAPKPPPVVASVPRSPPSALPSSPPVPSPSPVVVAPTQGGIFSSLSRPGGGSLGAETRVAAIRAPAAPAPAVVAFDAAAVPYLSEAQKASLSAYQTAAVPKALAVGASGAFAFAGNANGDATESDVRRRVLERCQYINKAPCLLYSVNGFLAQADVRAMTPTAVAIKGSGRFDPGAVPFIAQAIRDTKMTAYSTARLHKALVVHPSGAWASVGGRASVEEAVEAALQHCASYREHGCVVYAEDDEVVLDSSVKTRAIDGVGGAAGGSGKLGQQKNGIRP